jgi:hypothetical protein
MPHVSERARDRTPTGESVKSSSRVRRAPWPSTQDYRYVPPGPPEVGPEGGI